MLESVRRQFLLPRAVKVRVILTGRPSLAIESGQFLRDDTPVLTVREYTADQLGAYVSNVKAALNQKAVASTEQWPSVNWTVLREIVESYRKNSSKLDILGLPLLAHLSLRLLAQWQGGPQNLLSDRTALYRHLLDVTCQKAGKSSSDSDDLLGQARLKGSELRRMLQGTAVAITTCGQESISFRELKLRLRQNRHQMMETVTNAGRDHPLTSLMISFYFKGGQERLGCEFLHKSFREYLYAESIIEALKEYAKNLAVRIAKREPYWKDFETTDPRLQFSRNLSQLLCPYPLTSEIQEHIAKLLEWEIDRSQEEQKEVGIGEPLALVTFEQWKLIRNGLADLWDWWGDAVHLRPQPYRNDSETLCYKSAYVNELVDYSLPRDRTPDAPTWWPGRVVNVDSNIGDGLCRLNAWVHGHILNAQEWFNTSVELSTGRQGVDDRPYQYVIQPAGTTFVLFMPSGASLDYFRNYCSRINAAGNRPGGFFPGNIQLPGVCLSGADLSGANFNGADLRGADLRVTDFRGAKLRGAKFSGADLSGADLRGTDLSGADVSSASVFSACLGRANMIAILLDGADLTMADLTQTVRSGADISQVNFPDVKLDGKTQTRNRGGLSTAQ